MEDAGLGWDSTQDALDKAGGTFVSLKAGEMVRGVFVGDPCNWREIWVDGKSEVYDPDKHVGQPAFRSALNFFDVGLGMMRIFRLSATTLRVLMTNRKEYALDKGLQLGDVVFKIIREGSTKDDTKYNILFQENVSETLRGDINAAQLHDLVELCTKDQVPF